MSGINLKEASVRFLHDRCTGLRYDDEKTALEAKDGIKLGTSIRENQIPYNMQMDIDRLCFEKALERFLGSGAAREAFDVYFCFLEMFVGKYERTRTMVELLSEFENNGSSLLMKHRDHYSHSVYVFALGLAIYETNSAYRKIYADTYGIEGGGDGAKAAHHYLEHWGMTSLFHDIGYPLEIPFEQVASYFEVNRENRNERPFMAYHQMSAYAEDCFEILARNIADRLGKTYNFDEPYILDVMNRKPRHPEEFSYFMDHAVFSAVILYKRVYKELNMQLDEPDIDVLSAIILHNSMYKFAIAKYKEPGNIPLKAELFPLAYMLMLCDEIQSWDRTAYGRKSRNELNPMDCRLVFGDGSIRASYVYDIVQQYREASMKKKAPGNVGFDEDIASIVDISLVGLKSSVVWEKRDEGRKHTYLSDSTFLSLYNFGVALNGRYMLGDEWKEVHKAGYTAEKVFLNARMDDFRTAFEKMSLEYKLSNINQAKAFDRYLNEIGAFYTDRPVDCEELYNFTPEECVKIGAMEHERWLREHIEMGWKAWHGAPGEKLDKDFRENQRVHPDMIDDSLLIRGELTEDAARLHYKMLDKETQDKDVEPMNAMLALMNMFEGAKIYRLYDH